MFSLMPLYILPIPSTLAPPFLCVWYYYKHFDPIHITYCFNLFTRWLKLTIVSQRSNSCFLSRKEGAIIATLYFLGKIMILFRINLGHLSVLVKQLVPTWHFDNVQGDQISFCSGYLSGSFSNSCRYKIEDLGFRLMMMFHMIGRI
jgi:hypothetical protein